MAQSAGNQDAVGSHIGSEDSESMQQLDLDREFDSETSSSGKPVSLSTQCQIIAPGNIEPHRLNSNNLQKDADCRIGRRKRD